MNGYYVKDHKNNVTRWIPTPVAYLMASAHALGSMELLQNLGIFTISLLCINAISDFLPTVWQGMCYVAVVIFYTGWTRLDRIHNDDMGQIYVQALLNRCASARAIGILWGARCIAKVVA